MGFWSSFLGAGAAHVYNEMKKEEKETQKWNDNFHMTMNYEEDPEEIRVILVDTGGLLP